MVTGDQSNRRWSKHKSGWFEQRSDALKEIVTLFSKGGRATKGDATGHRTGGSFRGGADADETRFGKGFPPVPSQTLLLNILSVLFFPLLFSRYSFWTFRFRLISLSFIVFPTTSFCGIVLCCFKS